jgi:SdrD B-like domain
MRKTSWLIALLLLLFLSAGATTVQAQTAAKGAIRGTVYQDANADGVCGAGDPVMAGVQINFASVGAQPVSLVTFSDGTYGLASINLGTWQVTAQPPQGWVTTSLQTVSVTITSENNSANNVNFCLAQQNTSGGDGSNTLPESGVSVPPVLLVATVTTIAMMLVGIVMIAFARRMLR